MVTLDDMANALGFKTPQDVKGFAAYGEVKGINADETYQVSLNGSTTTVKCARLTGAHVGDVVLVTVLNNGYAVATGCVGGDTDALEAKAAADGTAQYFWYKDGTGDEAGAHVTKVPRSEFEADPQGGNLLMRTEGIAVRDGTIKLATFENSGITIGKEADTHTEFTTDGLKFYLDENTNPVNLVIHQDASGYRYGRLIANYNNIRQASVTADADGHTAYVHTGVYTDDPNDIEWATEVQTNARGIRQIVQAGGGQATYATVTLQPKSADPTSADYYNMEYSIGVPVRGSLETPTVSITATTGTLVSAAARRFGQVVQLYLQVRKTSNTAAGSNIFEGTLNTTALKPVIPARGASYFGTHSIVGALSAAGDIIIRNASSTAVTIGAGETAGITFTYLVA